MEEEWRVWVDTGGTFTDCLAVNGLGTSRRVKILSSSRLRAILGLQRTTTSWFIHHSWQVYECPLKGFFLSLPDSEERLANVVSFNWTESFIVFDQEVNTLSEGLVFELSTGEEAPVLAARLITQTPIDLKLDLVEFFLGTTKGTNALLEKKGEAPLLIVTKGFADLLEIGTQQRNKLFSLEIVKKQQLYSEVIEVDERIDSGGVIIRPLKESEINKVLREVFKLNPKVVVVALLNSYKNPVHEQTLRNLLKTSGYKYVLASTDLDMSVKILSRTQTAVVDGYLRPVLDAYLRNAQSRLTPDTDFKIICSSGGLVSPDAYTPKDSLLSGPAGGVIGTACIGKKLGLDKILAFDMGGTSTDVSRYNQGFDYVFETRVGDVSIVSPSLYLETVAAGGGSVCSFDGYRLTVGPESAGAKPGPACYGAGGPLTITDINLLLGRLNVSCFALPIDVNASKKSFAELKEKFVPLLKLRDEDILNGFLEIANEKMSNAIQKISVRKGYDPSIYALLAFGGAGGMHACSIANELNISQIVIPYDAGILSAYGIGLTQTEKIKTRQILQSLNLTLDFLETIILDLYQQAREELIDEGELGKNVVLEKTILDLRFKGQDDILEVNYETVERIVADFTEKYIQLFGHFIQNREIELVTVRCFVTGAKKEITPLAYPIDSYNPTPYESQKSYSQGHWVETPVFQIEKLKEGALLNGPAVVLNNTSSSFIDSGWQGIFNGDLDLILTRLETADVETARVFPEQVQLELFSNRFQAIASEMGVMLQRTAFSVNIKERLDFSCALLDSNGYLVVNAPHIPVHLGAIGLCVREVIKNFTLSDGDILVTNHPAYGGSHLPDVSLITPFFHNNKLVAYLANRAHHAEIGGISPGSMPANAKNLAEEGVVIKPMYLLKGGKSNFKEIEQLLSNYVYPSRSVQENIADLRAGIASLLFGKAKMTELCNTYTSESVLHYMAGLKKYASGILKESLKKFEGQNLTASEQMDDGSKIQLAIKINKGHIKIDFTGTSSQQKNNMNATPAIVNSAVLYTLRLLIDADIPLNEGLSSNLELILPSCMLNPEFTNDPANSPAVVGGNVELSQRLVDTLLKAFGVAACSQGTMNNFLFGNQDFGYYETICGGVGATPNSAGASAVHQHMTNTRITDPEVIEHRYPVRVERFAIRKGSGGAGKHRGGDGVERQLTFLEPVNATILSQHRIEKPYGIHNGEPGQCGEQFKVNVDGSLEALQGICSIDLQKGEGILIKTPGGGGVGSI